MRTLIGCFLYLALNISIDAEPLINGRVRLSSGQPIAGAQVRLFDRTDLRRWVGTTTDEAGHFTLSLQVLSGGLPLPQGFALGHNYPNPFNPSTIIPYQLSTTAHVRLEIFNLLGQRVATLVDEEQMAGTHTTQWDGTNRAGQAVGAGVYIYRLLLDGQAISRRMVLVDGQAGIPATTKWSPIPMIAAERLETDTGVYALTVASPGLVPYVDPTFQPGTNVANIVVKETANNPARMKRTADRILGDVTNDGQVDTFDMLYIVLYIALYSADPSITLPPSDISLGDVNGDGTVDVADVLLLATYMVNPSDPSLPAGIGQAVSEGTSDSDVGTSGGGGDGGDGGDPVPATRTAFESFSPWGYASAPLSYSGNVWGKPMKFTEDSHLGKIAYMVLGRVKGCDFVDAEADRGSHVYIKTESLGSLTGYEAEEVCRATSSAWGSSYSGLRITHLRFFDESSPTNVREVVLDTITGQYVLEVAEAAPMALDTPAIRLGSGHAQRPTWSPDSQRIAFSSRRGGRWGISAINVDGSDLVHLISSGGSPAWSPDGQRIAFDSPQGSNWGIWVMNTDGSDRVRLTDDRIGGVFPAWSPDGQRIAFASVPDEHYAIYVMNADGSGKVRLTYDAADSRLPAWSPDGQRIAFDSNRSGNYEIYVMDVDGSNIVQLTDNSIGDATPVWSPDGQRIAFVSVQDGNNEIYAMNADGSEPTRLTNNKAYDGSPSWSPDGQHIAFHSNRDGDFEIYVMKAP
ncbi:MAG: DPP IV N-terminal domain-containing protein [Gemmatimonadota bacterium]|nr:DPP IV N-terminal domain-containing protein [Gemmatimonadota bacterium]